MEIPKEAREGDPLAAKIKTWLSEQGYPLEMRVARVFKSHGISAVPSDYYFDQESGTHREIDLAGRIRLLSPEGGSRQISTYLCPIVECKSSPGKPWILFGGGLQLVSTAKIAQRFVLKQATSYWSRFARQLDQNPVARAELPLFDVEQDPSYSAVRSSLGKSREDVAYSAMTSVSKAAFGVANKYNAPGNLALQIAVPVIVVDSPIYKCVLDGSGDPDLARVTSGTIVWRNRVPGSTLPHSIVRVYSEEALPELCQEILKTAETLRRAIREEPWLGEAGE
ncbi:hypothetical protein HEP84_34080 [Streptomyces sp. RLB1-33]|nr:hypothetical protein [Streptomyces sp. RLB1-33]QIY73426.1 hypothetical protein HEP84_34080 [Streptomyces sp. RLB1-33]